MTDKFNNPVAVGDWVAFLRYSNVEVGQVVKVNDKSLKVNLVEYEIQKVYSTHYNPELTYTQRIEYRSNNPELSYEDVFYPYREHRTNKLILGRLLKIDCTWKKVLKLPNAPTLPQEVDTPAMKEQLLTNFTL